MDTMNEPTTTPPSYQAGLDELEAINKTLQSSALPSPDVLLHMTKRGQFLAKWLEDLITQSQKELDSLLAPSSGTEETLTRP